VQDTDNIEVKDMTKFEGAKVHTCTIYYLSNKRCRWPLWVDPDAVDKFYCGKPTAKDRVYCDTHCTMSYREKFARAS